MPNVKYKRYLEPHSKEEVPRTTQYYRRKGLKTMQASSSVATIDTSETGVMEFAAGNAENYSVPELTDAKDTHNVSCFELEDDIENGESSTSSSGVLSIFDSDNGDTENDESEIEPDDNILLENKDNNLSDCNVAQLEEDVHDVIEPMEPDDEEHLHDPYLSERLSPCTNTTRGEALMMAILLGMRHSLTWEAVTDILHLVNKLHNQDVVPTTKHNIFKYFPADLKSFKYHVYCSLCKKYAKTCDALKSEETIECNGCGKTTNAVKNTSFFLTLNFRAQLQSLLEDPSVRCHLNYRFNRQTADSEAIEDVYDGNLYRKMSSPGEPLSYRWNLSYTFNTDGCQTADSSKVSVWPIYVMLHELPPETRAKHMLLVGLWVNESEPEMNLYLKPFVDEANSLSTDGIEWELDGQKITSKIYPLCSCVDSVARCSMLKMKQYNGRYGCTFCEHPTESVDGFRKYTVSTDVPEERTDESTIEYMMDAYRSDSANDLKGVWGPSVLMTLLYYGIISGQIVDYLHAVLLGVVKQHTEILLSSPGHDYYAGSPNQIAVINGRLLAIRAPKSITRTPRSINNRRLWKGSEWRSWLIWYSLICLRGIIPKKYLCHLALLVTSIEILLQNSITPSMLDTARTSLIKYVVLYQEYFGKEKMTYNVHLLLHLSVCVSDWGPLWAINTFPFENENRKLLSMKKSPFRIASQVARRYLFYKSVPKFCTKFPNGDRFQEFLRHYEKRVKLFVRIEESVLIGTGKKYKLTETENALIGRPADCLAYQKIVCNGIRYVTESYARLMKTNDSIIVTDAGLRGVITNICSIKSQGETKVVIFFCKIHVEHLPFLATAHVKVTHISRCYPDRGTLDVCEPQALRGQCIIMESDGKNYIGSIPRGCRGD